MGHMQLIIVRNFTKLLIGCCYFSGSSSTPEEDRLLKHLFDPNYQPHNLMTTPVSSTDGTVNVTVGIEIRKIVALVRSKGSFLYHVLVGS